MTFAELAKAFAAPIPTLNFRAQAGPVEHKHQRAHGHYFYTVYLEKEAAADRWSRQLLQGAPTEDAHPCRRCGQLATTPLCCFCAIDQIIA